MVGVLPSVKVAIRERSLPLLNIDHVDELIEFLCSSFVYSIALLMYVIVILLLSFM